ncbi:MAG: hypothetical protein ABWW70_04330 [Thermoproteota archaeon]
MEERPLSELRRRAAELGLPVEACIIEATAEGKSSSELAESLLKGASILLARSKDELSAGSYLKAAEYAWGAAYLLLRLEAARLGFAPRGPCDVWILARHVATHSGEAALRAYKLARRALESRESGGDRLAAEAIRAVEEFMAAFLEAPKASDGRA